MKLCGRLEMRVGGGAFVFIAVAMFAIGRRESKSAKTASPVSNDVQVVTPISFEERNDGEDYNASGVVPLGDARFLFCDNHVADALYELDLTPDGQKQGALIRRPLQGIVNGSIDD